MNRKLLIILLAFVSLSFTGAYTATDETVCPGSALAEAYSAEGDLGPEGTQKMLLINDMVTFDKRDLPIDEDAIVDVATQFGDSWSVPFTSYEELYNTCFSDGPREMLGKYAQAVLGVDVFAASGAVCVAPPRWSLFCQGISETAEKTVAAHNDTTLEVCDFVTLTVMRSVVARRWLSYAEAQAEFDTFFATDGGRCQATGKRVCAGDGVKHATCRHTCCMGCFVLADQHTLACPVCSAKYKAIAGIVIGSV